MCGRIPEPKNVPRPASENWCLGKGATLDERFTMVMNGTALFISALALAATPIVVVLSQDSSVDQDVRLPAFAAASPQRHHQPSQVTHRVRRTEPKARCTASATTAHAACRGRR
jgi:hypothetical protein